MAQLQNMRCVRASITHSLLLYFVNAKATPPFIVVTVSLYLCISAVITVFDAGRRTLLHILFHWAPFAAAICIAGELDWLEITGLATLTLPFMQSLGVVPVKVQNIVIGITCSMILLEIAGLCAKRQKGLYTLSVVHSSAVVVIALSIVSVAQPQCALSILLNPLFLFTQGFGAFIIWATFDDSLVSLQRQHTISACLSLSVAFVFVFTTFVLSGVTGDAVLSIGETYKQNFASVETYLGLAYPSILFIVANTDNGCTDKPTHYAIARIVRNILLNLDRLFVPMIAVGPYVMRLGWCTVAMVTGSETEWARMPAMILTILLVTTISMILDRIISAIPFVSQENRMEKGYQMSTTLLPEDILEGLEDTDNTEIKSGEI